MAYSTTFASILIVIVLLHDFDNTVEAGCCCGCCHCCPCCSCAPCCNPPLVIKLPRTCPCCCCCRPCCCCCGGHGKRRRRAALFPLTSLPDRAASPSFSCGDSCGGVGCSNCNNPLARLPTETVRLQRDTTLCPQEGSLLKHQASQNDSKNTFSPKFAVNKIRQHGSSSSTVKCNVAQPCRR